MAAGSDRNAPAWPPGSLAGWARIARRDEYTQRRAYGVLGGSTRNTAIDIVMLVHISHGLRNVYDNKYHLRVRFHRLQMTYCYR